jgi:hypothetical protein
MPAKGYKKEFTYTEDENGCLLCTSHFKEKSGYYKVKVNRKSKFLHRIIYQNTYLKGEEIPKGSVICHRCDNKSCCNPEHLFLGTQNDNMKDMIAKGRSARGETHPNHSLTKEQVEEIFLDTTSTLVELGKKYGVKKNTIHYIKKGKTWSSVTSKFLKEQINEPQL